MSLEFVVGLYDFQAQNPTELSFKANERLQILYHPPDDPMWWMARNDRGFSGLVPVNYVKVVSDNAFQPTTNLFDSNVFSGKEWFFGRVSRKDAEDLLSQRGEVGDFLIRNSETQSGELSLSRRQLHHREPPLFVDGTVAGLVPTVAHFLRARNQREPLPDQTVSQKYRTVLLIDDKPGKTG
uniref:Uncharacterized protein n=1 Tax=Panagrolaimus sp. JU765 TaxID=591449 RepID=A0AC34R8X2_9BILA